MNIKCCERQDNGQHESKKKRTKWKTEWRGEWREEKKEYKTHERLKTCAHRLLFMVTIIY